VLILGGYTGSGKTSVLKQLKKEGQMTVDLEELAGHRGSAFGNLDQHEQPGQEQFENLLAGELARVENKPGPVWVEGESQRIGTVNIPNGFFATMRASPLVFLDIPFEKRLDQIVEDYGKFNKQKMITAIVRIKKRLGGLETKNAVNYLLEDVIRNCFAILLKYYDRLYLKSTLAPGEESRKVTYVTADTTDTKMNLKKLITYAG
jgi:tRNA 2-selenouridine synthase